MEKHVVTKHLILASVLCAGVVLSALTTRGQLQSTAPVAHKLPVDLGALQSIQVLHCQNFDCAHSPMQDSQTDVSACPECGAEMDTASPAENQLLPSDTRIDRRIYTAPSGRRFTVSVVEGGYERRSIHKPQRCLVGQGNTITRQYQLPIPLPIDSDFNLMLLELNASSRIFAYWFTDGQRQTASHIVRLFWIAWDGVVHNERRRWAYISIMTASDDLSSAIAELKPFVRGLHSHVSQ